MFANGSATAADWFTPLIPPAPVDLPSAPVLVETAAACRPGLLTELATALSWRESGLLLADGVPTELLPVVR